MFTLKDLEMLQIPEGTKAIIIREKYYGELDSEMKQLISKQFKKALKLPVLFIPNGVEVAASQEEIV